MINRIIFTCLLFTIIGDAYSQSLPVIRAYSKTVDILDGNSYRKAYWTVLPEVKPDVYFARRNKNARKITFYTDVDSISFHVTNGKQYDFIILLNGKDTSYTRISTLRETYQKKQAGFNVTSDTIPFWLGDDNKVHVKGRVNGSEELDFMFDTGADQCVLFRSGMKKAKLNFDGTIENSGFGGTTTRQLSNQNSLEISNLIWKNEAFMFIDSKSEEDGILGYNIFEDKIVEIDYDNKIIVVHDKPIRPHDSYSSFEIKYAGTLPLIDLILINGNHSYPGQVVFDMGAKSSLFLTQQYLARNDLRETLNKKGSRTSGGVGPRKIKSDYVIIPEIKIGKTSLIEVPMDLEVVSPDPIIHHNILGMDIIKRFNAIIDYQNHKIYLRPNNLVQTKYLNPPGRPLWLILAAIVILIITLAVFYKRLIKSIRLKKLRRGNAN